MNATVPIEMEEFRLGSAPSPASAPNRRRDPHLTPVTAPATKPRKVSVLGAVIAVGVILGIFAAQLSLSIAVSEGAYESNALEVEQRDLLRVERVLSQNLEKLASPQNLAENATALGMVQNVTPATIRLSDGTIQGSLESKTKQTGKNLVPNSQLESLPIVDAQGLLTNRNADEAPAVDVEAAVRWEGKLPAPQTH